MILAVSAIFVGAVTQRIAGMGFAMMVAPFVVLALGPSQGVVLVNLCGAVAATVTMFTLLPEIRWSAVGWLLASSLVGVILGSVVVHSLNVPVFQTLIGSVLLLAVVTSVLLGRTSLTITGVRWMITAGAATGALVASAGIGGPPMSIYAVLSKWEQRSFAATMQPYTAAISLIAVAASLIIAPLSWPALSGALWLILAATIAVGLLVGTLLGRVVSPATARAVVIGLALVGAVITLITGVVGLGRT